jgi:hypothetical protein
VARSFTGAVTAGSFGAEGLLPSLGSLVGMDSLLFGFASGLTYELACELA